MKNWLLLIGVLAAGNVGAEPDTALQRSRAPLTIGGKEVFEARRVILDGDSYPRPPAQLVAGPTATKTDRGFTIRFAVDRFDDVVVRIVGPTGETVRTLGCGVLGPNAPVPFQKNSLQQELAWDGKAPAGCRVEVGVGLTPRFDRFIGYDPGQLLNGISWLECDPKGRVYVQLATSRKWDPVILRFNRDGVYEDMVYPSNPGALQKAGKKIEDVWPFTVRYDGETVPHRPRAWPAYTPYRSSAWIPLPMRSAASGDIFFAETSTGWPSFAGYGKLFRVFQTHMDAFFLLNDTPLTFPIGPFAIDDKGCAYLVTTVSDQCSTYYPTTAKNNRHVADLNDQNAPGTIRKVDLRTGELRADFEFNGPTKLDGKSAYLGTTQQVKGYGNGTVWVPNTERRPNPASDDANHFLDIADIAVNRAGQIVVADGWPRRLKVYAANGRFLGEVPGLTVAGQRQRFRDLRGIAFADGGFFLLGKFQGATRSFLAKCTGNVLNPTVVWTTDLDPLASRLAVDRSAKLPVVWVAMGHGEATLTRVADTGPQPGEIRCIGGPAKNRLVYPWSFTADAAGNLYVHDRERDVLVKTDGTPGSWKETKLLGAPISFLVDAARRRLLVACQLGEDGAYSRAFAEEGGLLAFDLDTLERLPFRLESVFNKDELASKDKSTKKPDLYYPWAKTSGGHFAGMDRDGNLYVRDAARDGGWHKTGPRPDNRLPGVIRKYTADGTITNEAVCRLASLGGAVAMDSQGCFYVAELPECDWGAVVHDFGGNLYQREWNADHDPKRDGQTVRLQSDLTHLVKMAATGGDRNTDAELWAHRGVSSMNGGGCMCEWPDILLAIDGADRICAANSDTHMVKILDTAGNMITRVGRWGNAETVPGPDGNTRNLGFSFIYCVAAAGDNLYVGDKQLRRIAKMTMSYRETKTMEIP